MTEREAAVAREDAEVAALARDEVVHPDDLVALAEEALAEVRAQEAGRAGDEDAHGGSTPGSR